MKLVSKATMYNGTSQHLIIPHGFHFRQGRHHLVLSRSSSIPSSCLELPYHTTNSELSLGQTVGHNATIPLVDTMSLRHGLSQ